MPINIALKYVLDFQMATIKNYERSCFKFPRFLKQRHFFLIITLKDQKCVSKIKTLIKAAK